MKHYRIKRIILPILFGLALVGCSKKEIDLKSPDGTLNLQFSLQEGVPTYSVTKGEQAVLLPSKMGMAFIDQDDMLSGFKLMRADTSSFYEKWEQPWGEFKFIEDKHKELVVHLKEQKGKGRLMDIVFRLFNDGVGFRYVFPEQPNLKSVKIEDERTEFTFAEDHNVWWIPVHSENSFYESFYRKTKISETDTINTPATFETKSGLHLAIHEANLTDFASMTLRKTQNNQYTSELVPWSNGVKVYAEAPFQTPWRTMIVAEKAGDLVTSTLMLNLNEPCAIEDISWIEPSKYIGIWWGMHLEKYSWSQGPKHGATTENAKKYIDFASKHGFDGVLIEGWNYGWDGDWTVHGDKFSFTKAYPDFDLEEICNYGVDKNVRLIGHHETGGAARNYENQIS